MTNSQILDVPKPGDDNFVTFRKFTDKDSAQELAGLLERNKILFQFEDTSGYEPFMNNENSKEFRIRLRKFDFPRAENLLMEDAKLQLNDLDKDYYLFSFSDEELEEIVANSDEWNQLDYLLALKLLKERGKEVKKEKIEVLQKERLKELAKPSESLKGWLYFGYATAIFGGIVSIFLGWHILTHKRTLPNGDQVYSFSKSDRVHGKRIFLLGLIFLLLWIGVRFYFY
jgi:hypothetical protein